MFETRVFDRMHFFSLQNKAFGPFFELKRGPQIGYIFLAYKQRGFSKVYPVILSGLGTLEDKLSLREGGGKKMLETRALDRIIFLSLQTKAFGPFFEFILSKTRAPDRINFSSLQTKGFQQSLSYYPIWAGDSS